MANDWADPEPVPITSERTRLQAKLELAWRRASSDVLYMAGMWWIQHPLGARQWELYPAQREILSSWATGENHLHLKARQLGFSTSVAFFAWWLAYFNPDTKILLISKGEREAQLLLDKVKFGHDRIPEWMRLRGPKVKSWTKSVVELTNGSEVVSLPSASNPGRGFTGRLIVVDEWAFLDNSEEAWASIEPTADIGGQIIGLSTANGVGNQFHALWVAAEAGNSTFKAMFYPWSAIPGRDAEWYARKKRSFTQEWQLHQEYPTDPEEAFIRSGASVFNVDALRELVSRAPERYVIENPGLATCRLLKDSQGQVAVYQKPLINRQYTMGVDVAEGLGHGDYSSIHVVDVVTRDLVATWHGHMEADLFGLQVHSMGLIYNTALCVPESNNHGLTTITELRRSAYPKIYRSRSINRAGVQLGMQFGFKTTRGTKAPLIDGLAGWLREGNDMPCAATKSELMTFTRNDRGAMSGSPHDDRVISLALAVWGLEYANQPEYRTPVDDYMTADWWIRQCNDDPGGPGGISTLREAIGRNP